MTKDKGKGKETKPSLEIEDGAVKAKKAKKQRPKMFLPFNRARKKTFLLQPRPKASVNIYHVFTNVKTT